MTNRNSMLRRVVTVASLTVAILATLGVWAPASAAPDAGALYKAKCSGCHGTDGSGDTPVGKNLKAGDLRSAAIQAKTDAQLTEAIAKGKGKMQAFGKKLSADEIAALVAYVRSLGKPKAA